MENESGVWVVYGVDENDPECIHTVEETIEYINRIGFLPFFKNDIPGFSCHMIYIKRLLAIIER
jgi:hypothetical protein